MTDEDEYRFYPDDFDDNGDLVDENDGGDLAPRVIVISLGAGIALFFANPFIEPIAVAGTELELRSISAFVFAIGLFAGSGMYVREGNRSLSAVHALGAVGWVFVGIGGIRSNSVLFITGGVTLVAGAIGLVVLVWRSL